MFQLGSLLHIFGPHYKTFFSVATTQVTERYNYLLISTVANTKIFIIYQTKLWDNVLTLRFFHFCFHAHLHNTIIKNQKVLPYLFYGSTLGGDRQILFQIIVLLPTDHVLNEFIILLLLNFQISETILNNFVMKQKLKVIE